MYSPKLLQNGDNDIHVVVLCHFGICACAQNIPRYRNNRYRRPNRVNYTGTPTSVDNSDWNLGKPEWLASLTHLLILNYISFYHTTIKHFRVLQIKLLFIKRQMVLYFKIRFAGNIICLPLFFHLDYQIR